MKGMKLPQKALATGLESKQVSSRTLLVTLFPFGCAKPVNRSVDRYCGE
jgi:hypothetical protein